MQLSGADTNKFGINSTAKDDPVAGASRFFVTVPIHHPLSTPTIGQTYPYVLADVLTRFARLKGKETYLLAGTDEFGLAMMEAATSSRLSPAALAEQNSERFQRYWRSLDVKFTNFVRTTEKSHKNTVQNILRRLWRTGDIFEKFPNTFSGHQRATRVRQSEYCFRLSKYRCRIIEHIRDNPDFIRPAEARTKALQLLRSPSPEPVVSRAKLKYDWGVELPFAPDKIAYVWLDGLISYLTPLVGSQKGGKHKIWPPDLQIISLDLVQTHAIYWPAILMALDIDLPRCILFYKNFSDNLLVLTEANSEPIDTPENIDELRAVLSGYNALRHNVRSNAVDKHSVQVLGLLTKLEQIVGMVAERERTDCITFAAPDPMDERLRKVLGDLIQRVDKYLTKYKIHLIVEDCHSVVEELLTYMQPQLARPTEHASRLKTAAECAAAICSLLHPIMPRRMSKLWDRLGMPSKPAEYLYGSLKRPLE